MLRPWVYVLLFSIAGAAQGADVQTLDGQHASGQLSACDAAGVRIVSRAGDQFIASENLLRVDLAVTASVATPPLEVRLVDGSSIPVMQAVSARDELQCDVQLPGWAEPQRWLLPAGEVQSIRLQQPTDVAVDVAASLMSAWQDQQQSDAAADRVVIRKPGSTTLQAVEGALSDIAPDVVHFQLGDEAIEVKRDRIYGVIYYRTADDDQDASGVMVEGRSGWKLVGQTVTLVGDELQIARAGERIYQVPLGEVAAIDFSRGRLAYLSDLEPFRVESLETAVERQAAVDEWWLPRRNMAFDGGPLTLAFPPQADEHGPGLPRRAAYAKGLAIRGPMSVVYRLPRGYQRLVTTIGGDPSLRRSGAARWELRAGDQLLAEGIVERQSPPIDVECSVADVRELTLCVMPANEPPTAFDVFAMPLVIQFCNARLLK